MTRDLRDYIEDMLTSLDEVQEFTHGMSFDAFEEDRKTRNAVVRSLEVLGEAAKKLPESVQASAATIPWKQMAGMRDKLIHAYFGVDWQIVWLVATEELPPLRPALEDLRRQFEPPEHSSE